MNGISGKGILPLASDLALKGELDLVKLVNRASLSTSSLAPKPPLSLELRSDASRETLIFMTQGLTLIPEKLRALERWLQRHGLENSTDRDQWGAAWASRRWPELGTADSELSSWLAWEQGLFSGQTLPRPQDGEFWDLWNSHPQAGTQRWVICPFAWEFEGASGQGLLKAAFHVSSLALTCWTVTAAPGGTPVQLSASQIASQWVLQMRVDHSSVYDNLQKQWPVLTAVCAQLAPELSLRLVRR